jgi:quercetin dioxygenase-like cupin family protein
MRHEAFMRAIFLLAILALPVSPLFAEAEAYRREIELKPLLKTQIDSAGKPIVYPTGCAEVSAVHVIIPPGAQTGWHKHPVPCFAYILEGELDVQLASGETKTLKAGEAFAESVDVMHNGANKGGVPVKLVMFAAGTCGQPYAVKPPAPAEAK